jgi:uracil-DNA glycosylase
MTTELTVKSLKQAIDELAKEWAAVSLDGPLYFAISPHQAKMLRRKMKRRRWRDSRLFIGVK